MLSEIRISGLGVIDDAVLTPHPGLTAVTGETGAGKTMVVTALGLIGGGRADSGRVRAAAGRAVVEARVEVAAGHPAQALVTAAGGAADEDGSYILVRSVGADGRSRAHAGGRSVPVSVLAETAGTLLTVHGQQEATALLQPAQQRAVLDRYAGTETLLETYRARRAAWLAAVADLADRSGRARERAQREQVLRLGMSEIDQVAPTPGEDSEIVAEIRRLENSDQLRAAAEGARTALVGEDLDAPAAVGLLETARKLLAATEDERLIGWAGRLHETSAVIIDHAADLSGYLDDLDADPQRLEQLLHRQAVLRTLTRRYGADINAVLAWRADAAAELAELDSSEEAAEAAVARCAQTAAAAQTAAGKLSAQRAKAARRLAEAATGELAHLAMGRATLLVAVTHRVASDPGGPEVLQVGGQACTAGVDGVDAVEFLMQSHAGAPELPVARAASGGELSRIMLALEVVLAGSDPVDTLIFDEVDAGVGGRAATEIGRRLAALARDHQVIVVTHLAQVAAFADRQVVVDAAEDGAVRSSSLREVVGAERQAELARMLGGTDGDTARAHAAELLAAAGHA